MRSKLCDRDWKEFKLNSIFRIENCKCSKASRLLTGKTPYVGATNKNNGIMKFVKSQNGLVSKGNCIIFICDGEGSVGYSIYKKENFIGSTTLKVGRNNQLNKYSSLFITTVADRVRGKYNFGFKRNEKHLKNEILLLPVSSTGEPDYVFMEEYMREKEQILIKKYKNYILKRLDKLKDCLEVKSLSEKDWKEFDVINIFSKIQRGKRIKKSDHISGKMPYVSSTAENNGIDNYVSNDKNVRIFSNCLTLANSGSVGSCFYQPFNIVASDHVTHLKNSKLSKYSYLFISHILSRLGEKYSFNREISDKRLKREKILLPINKIGEPDYKYMENYMKKIEHKKLKQYLKYLENKFI